MDTIALSDKNEYLVISKVVYLNNTYYYLVDEKNNENARFCLEKAETKSMIEICDVTLIQTLIPLFSSTASKYSTSHNPGK